MDVGATPFPPPSLKFCPGCSDKLLGDLHGKHRVSPAIPEPTVDHPEEVEPVKKLLFLDEHQPWEKELRATGDPRLEDWEWTFVKNSEEAISCFQNGHVDVMVSNVSLRGTDVAKLLGDLRTQSPRTVRIAYSDQMGLEASLRSAGVAHQFLTSPFSPQDLIALIDRTCALRDLLENDSLQKLVSGIKTLPSLPSIYHNLMKEMHSTDPSIKKVAGIVGQDIGMVTKILQMVNSPFFGLRNHVSNPEQAVMLLGLETIKSLVLSLQVFSQFEGAQSFFSLEALWNHGLVTSSYARAIAKDEGAPTMVVEDAVAAALLHDVGTLVLATNLPDQFAETLALQQNEGLAEWEAERKVLGASHAEIGAYLLGIWGLGDSLVEAVAFHHTPMMCVSSTFIPLTAVHVANALEEEARAADFEGEINRFDETYLGHCGMQDHLVRWRAICRTISEAA